MLTASDMLLASRAEECSPPESLPHLAQAVSARDIAEERWDCGRAMRFHVYYHGAYGPRLSTALRFHFLVPMGPHMPVRGGNVTSAVDTMASIWEDECRAHWFRNGVHVRLRLRLASSPKYDSAVELQYAHSPQYDSGRALSLQFDSAPAANHHALCPTSISILGLLASIVVLL